MFPDYGDIGGTGIHSPGETMMPKLSILSSKGEAVGFQSDSKTEFEEYYANDKFPVEVLAENAQFMKKDSLILKYRTELMLEDEWKDVVMTCVENCDVKDYSDYNTDFTVPVRNSVYKAYVPATEESMNVQFYAVAQDSRLANENYGGYITTGYGASEPIEIFVDDIIGFGNGIVDFFAVAIMMGIMYGVVWGGLYKTVGIATEAERRKNEEDEIPETKKKAKRS